MSPPRIKNLKSRLTMLDQRVGKALPKETDDHYGTAEHRAWALGVKQRAGWRCEHVENGVRCSAHYPTSTLYGDHIVEVKDDPRLKLDPKNGRCLCASHHQIKTRQIANERMRS